MLLSQVLRAHADKEKVALSEMDDVAIANFTDKALDVLSKTKTSKGKMESGSLDFRLYNQSGISHALCFPIDKGGRHAGASLLAACATCNPTIEKIISPRRKAKVIELFDRYGAAVKKTYGIKTLSATAIDRVASVFEVHIPNHRSEDAEILRLTKAGFGSRAGIQLHSVFNGSSWFGNHEVLRALACADSKQMKDFYSYLDSFTPAQQIDIIPTYPGVSQGCCIMMRGGRYVIKNDGSLSSNDLLAMDAFRPGVLAQNLKNMFEGSQVTRPDGTPALPTMIVSELRAALSANQKAGSVSKIETDMATFVSELVSIPRGEGRGVIHGIYKGVLQHCVEVDAVFEARTANDARLYADAMAVGTGDVEDVTTSVESA